jgi:hypothetical protein
LYRYNELVELEKKVNNDAIRILLKYTNCHNYDFDQFGFVENYDQLVGVISNFNDVFAKDRYDEHIKLDGKITELKNGINLINENNNQILKEVDNLFLKTNFFKYIWNYFFRNDIKQKIQNENIRRNSNTIQ